jgi:type VI secretion system secreted protein VgrG
MRHRDARPGWPRCPDHPHLSELTMPQSTRFMDLHTPLGDGALLLRTMSGTEALGALFEYHISALSSEVALDAGKILGKSVTVKLEQPDDSQREFSGIVTRFGLTGVVGRHFEYQLTVRPWLWLLTRSNNVRIFQNKTATEIIDAVVQPYTPDLRQHVTATYESREYCVQYRESDFDFISRLMEEEGLYYYFEHKNGKHTMVLTDGDTAHSPSATQPQVAYRESLAGGIDLEAVTRWQFSELVQPGKVVLTDYFYDQPTQSHDGRSARLDVGGRPSSTVEYYDYNVGMGPNNVPYNDTTQINARSGVRQHRAKLKANEFATRERNVSAESNARGIATGSTFTLKDFPRDDQNAEHLVVSTSIQMGYGEYEGNSGAAPYFSCQFTALHGNMGYVPAQRTPKPRVGGPQSAVVVGPDGQEINTDELGRVKVQFHWDREGQSNDASSCWVRVTSPWAGKGWGMLSLPRIGQEVIVDFLEGNPDLPIITGRVYNTDQTVPYELPAHATVSTIKSRSSAQGSTSNFNELRFEDDKGNEYIWLQAEKDFRHLVKNDSLHDIGNDAHVTIKNDRKEKVGNNQHLEVVTDLKQKIGGDAHLETGTDYLIKVGSQYSLKSGQDLAAEAGTGVSFKAGTDVHIKGGSNVTIEAGVTLTLKAGGSTIVLGPSGVAIVGTMVNVNSGGGGSGASPVGPASPAAPEAPTAPEDPLAS